MWLNQGDANTKFFHMSTLNRRRRNRITSLKDSVDNWSYDHNEIQELILNYYLNLFTTEQDHSAHIITEIDTCLLNFKYLQALDEPLKDNKITQTLYIFSLYKAPGPDGFHPFFLSKILA